MNPCLCIQFCKKCLFDLYSKFSDLFFINYNRRLLNININKIYILNLKFSNHISFKKMLKKIYSRKSKYFQYNCCEIMHCLKIIIHALFKTHPEQNYVYLII